MKHLRSILFSTTVIIASGCTSTLPIAATSNPVGTKVGTAKETTFCGINLGGEASVRAAIAQGGITRVTSVDLRRSNVLGVLRTSTCIVTGE